jgi:mRNA interferase MazF
MPSTTDYRFGDVVLVPFPFTDQTTEKKRPAVVISSDAYHRDRPDIILMAITSRLPASAGSGEVLVEAWRDAGLLRPSVIKPVIATIERGLVLRRLGQVGQQDRRALTVSLGEVLGE